MARRLAFRLVPSLKLVNLTKLGRRMVGSGKELSPGEVAARLRVSPKTVTRWEKTGDLIPSQVLPSGYRRYDPADVEMLGEILAKPASERETALAALRAKNLGNEEADPTPA